MEQSLVCVMLLFFLKFFCCEAHQAVLNLTPKATRFYVGENLTFTCDDQQETQLDLNYNFSHNGEIISSCRNKKSCSFQLTRNSSGEYQCTTGYNGTRIVEGKNINLTVLDKPKPNLTVSLWLTSGSLILKCSVDPSAEWKIFWYKAVNISNNAFRLEQLAGLPKDLLDVAPERCASRYVCRGKRGKSTFYTEYSKPRFIPSGSSHSSCGSIKVVPDQVQHFYNESVSLHCEGTSSEWRVMSMTAAGRLANCSSWGTMTGSTCLTRMPPNNTAMYWCESASGFTNPVNLTVARKEMILVSPTQPVTQGQAVTLGCKMKNRTFDSNVLFYRNNKLIQNDTRVQLHIGAVSFSDEGFYKCEHSGEVSPKSWMSVKPPSKLVGPSFLHLAVGLLGGALLITCLLLFLYHLNTRAKDDTAAHAELVICNRKEKRCQDRLSPAAVDEHLYSVINF